MQNQSRGELHSTALHYAQTQINIVFALIFQLNWTRIFLMKPHSFTFSRFTTRKTTNHTRNLRQTTRTVRGGLGMRWLRGRGISLRYPFWEDNFLFCCLLIGELDPMSTDKPLLLFACCVLGQNALLSQSALLCTLPVEYEPVMIPRARTCHVLALCRRLCCNCGNAKM